MNIQSVAFFFLILLSSISQAQDIPVRPNITDDEGRRQGDWAIWFDQNWQPADTLDSIAFYRLITYQDDLPVDTVRDYYGSGVLQWKGILLIDRPKEVLHGEYKWFREDGTFEKTAIYEKGKLIEQTFFDDLGKKLGWQEINEKGIYALKNGNYELASYWFLNTIKLSATSDNIQIGSYVTIAENLAYSLKLQKQYGESEKFWLIAKDLREKALTKFSPDYVSSVKGLADMYEIQGLYEKAEPLYLEVLAIHDKVFGNEHPDYATSLNNLAGVYKSQGLYYKAETLYLEAKEIRSKKPGTNHPDYATSLNDLALLYMIQGLYNKAEPLYLEAKEIYSRVLSKESDYYATSLNNLALLYNIQGLYDEAESMYLEALEIRERVLSKDHNKYAASLSNLAELYENQGRYSKAESLQLAAKETMARAFGTSHPDYATALNRLGMIYTSQGLYDKAQPVILEANQIYAEVLGKSHPSYITSASSLASLYKKQGSYRKAEQLHLETLEVTKDVLGTNHPQYGILQGNLAGLYSSLGLYAKAEPLYMEALEITGKVSGKDHPSYATSLVNLAFLYNSQGLYAKAEPLYVEALEIHKNALSKDHPNYAIFLNHLAFLYQDQGLYAKAEPLILESNDILVVQIERNFTHLSEKEKSLYYKTFADHFEIFHSFVLKRYGTSPFIISENYKNVLATKGLLFQSSQKVRNAVLLRGDLALVRLYEQWQKHRAQLSTFYEKPILERKKAGVDIAKEEAIANDLEKQLSSRSALFASATDRTRYTWQDVQGTLKKGEAAIELVRFVYYDKAWTDSVLYAAMIVTPMTKDHPEWVVLPNGAELETRSYKSYRNAVKYQAEDDQSYQTYWAPLAAYLSGVSKVYLSAEGVYHSISLEGLLNPETGKYLADEIEIHRVGSTKDLVVAKRQKQPTESVELLGYPAYNLGQGNNTNQGYDRSLARAISQDGSTRFFDGGDIPLLPGTEEEVRNMKDIFSESETPVTTYLAEAATEEVVKGWENPKIAHIATHGYFLKDADLDKEDNRIGGFDKEALYENPLLRSGLLLANAKQAFEQGGDGILTAYEARDLHLDETELVVLSACETGLGEVKNGEGVYGLQRAFMAAGASSVIMSLWTVNDQSTQELMTAFYRNWLVDRQEKREAFRNAKLALREKYPHPYYWAAFVMMGE